MTHPTILRSFSWVTDQVTDKKKNPRDVFARCMRRAIVEREYTPTRDRYMKHCRLHDCNTRLSRRWTRHTTSPTLGSPDDSSKQGFEGWRRVNPSRPRVLVQTTPQIPIMSSNTISWRKTLVERHGNHGRQLVVPRWPPENNHITRTGYALSFTLLCLRLHHRNIGDSWAGVSSSRNGCPPHPSCGACRNTHAGCACDTYRKETSTDCIKMARGTAYAPSRSTAMSVPLPPRNSHRNTTQESQHITTC